MRQQSYLVRKGARYHFRRRLASDYKRSRPITISLNTAEPDEARRLARRLAVRWDEMMMEWHSLERSTLTRDEQRQLFRKGLEDELARASRHLTIPGAKSMPHPATNMILAAAYEIIRRLPPNAATLGPEDIDAVIDDSWSEQARSLLRTTLKLYVHPAMVSSGAAALALKDIGAPVNDATALEARATILRGWIEAQRRAELLGHPLLVATGDPVRYILDDDLVRQARTTSGGKDAPQKAAPETPPRSTGFFAKPCSIRFSEQIDALVERVFSQNGWQPDNGKAQLAYESFAWITGDKEMSAYGPSDIEAYVSVLSRIPNNFEWGQLGKSGAMAKPFDPALFSKKAPTEHRRSARTINSYLSKLQAASEILKKTHWLPTGGQGNLMMFSESMIKVKDDPANPRRVPWTPDHLRTLYQLPLWQGAGGSNARLKPGRTLLIYQDAAYWVPLLGTYTGLAREEACGLEVVDFNFDCEIPYLVVQANMTRSKDGVTKAGLKRPSRYRVMPLHPELLELGLKQYVQAIADEGHPMIFPELYLPEARDAKENAKVPTTGGRRFYAIAWCYIMDATHAMRPLPETADGKKADFHSQRTYNNSVLASPEVSETIIAMHMGHARKGTGPRNYNRRALTLGEKRELQERRQVLINEMPVVTAHVPRTRTVNLLALSKRSRVGSAPGRNAKSRFCK